MQENAISSCLDVYAMFKNMLTMLTQIMKSLYTTFGKMFNSFLGAKAPLGLATVTC